MCSGMRDGGGIFALGGEAGRVADRVAGVAWLGEIRDRLELERYQAVKAGLTTWFHLTGGAKVGSGIKLGGTENPTEPAGKEGRSLSQGGRVSGEAGSWKEAGERFKGFLACKANGQNKN